MKRYKYFIILVFFFIIGTLQLIAQDGFGTIVPSRLIDAINSESSAEITSLNMVTYNDVFVDGELFIKKGTRVENSVKVTKRKGVGKPGIIEIIAISTTNTSDQVVLLNGTYVVEGVSNRGKALGVGLGVGLGTILFPMIAFIAKKGEPVDIKPNTIINQFYVVQ